MIRIFGITAGGNSVGVHVHNFTPYFYVEVDTRKITLIPSDLAEIKNYLNNWSRGSNEDCVRGVE